VKILVTSAKQGFDIRRDLNTFFHSALQVTSGAAPPIRARIRWRKKQARTPPLGILPRIVLRHMRKAGYVSVKSVPPGKDRVNRQELGNNGLNSSSSLRTLRFKILHELNRRERRNRRGPSHED
jgi:hypothetical protein